MLFATLTMLVATAAANDVQSDALSLESLTVEASKLPVPPSDIASSITFIGGERIERELIQTINDLARYEPGIDVVDQGSRFGFSGITIRGIGGNRVKIEVDGIASADAFSIGSFSNASRDLVDVDSLKQVEIIRGPASAVFGSDALGGVVSFVTKGPGDFLGERDLFFDASAGFNSVDSSFNYRATAAARHGNISAMIRATYRDGEERDTPGADPLSEESLNLLGKLDFGDPADGGLGLTLEHFVADSRTEVDSLERIQDFTQAFGYPYVIETTEVAGDDQRDRSRVSLGQEWLAGRFGTDYLRWRAYWQDSDTGQDTLEARDSLIAGTAASVRRDRQFSFSQRLVGFEVNAASDFEIGKTSHLLAYGIEYESTDTAQMRSGTELDLLTGAVSNRLGPDDFPVRDFPKSRTERIGVYLQDRISIGALSLTPGVRWDGYELDPKTDSVFVNGNPGIEPVEFDDNQLSPKLGAIWQLNDSWQAYAQYSEGFRAPPVNDVNVGFTNFQFGYTTIPNPDLRSESSEGYELGIRFTGESAEWELAGFKTNFDDFIEPFQVVGFDPANQLLIFQSINVDKVRIEGAELSARLQLPMLSDEFGLNLAAAYADGKDLVSGLPLNSVAPFNAVVGLNYTQAEGRWGASLVARGASQQGRLNETQGDLLSPPGHVIFDAFGFWRPTQNTRVRAGVYNATDHDYTAYLDVQGVPVDSNSAERFQRPGRHISLAFDWTF